MISFIGAGTAASGAYEGDMARGALHLRNRAQTLEEERALTAAVQNQEKLEMEQEQNEWGRAVDKRKLDMAQEQAEWSRIVDKQRMRESDQRIKESEIKVKQGQAEFERYNMLFQEEKEEKEKQKWLAQTGISSAMKIAAMNGGVVPASCVNALNADFNLDPSKGDKFVGGGFQKDGTFVLDFAKTDPQTGQTKVIPQVFSPVHQMRAIQQTGIYDEGHMNNLYKTLMRSGMRPEQIFLDSKIYPAGQAQGQGRRGARAAQSEMKDHLSALSAIKGFIDSNEGNLDEETLNGLKAAYSNGIMGIASQYAPRQPEPGETNAPRLNKDGTLTLPNGTTLRKNQEYTNPQDGKKYIWRGGDARNFEAI